MAAIKYNIIFRTCDKVNSLHSTPRPFGLDKKSIIKYSFKSLLDFMKVNDGTEYNIHILGDELSNEMLVFFNSYPNLTIINEKMGNDLSIKRSFDLALSFPEEEYVYFCEDDYLHVANSIIHVNSLIINHEKILSNYKKRVLFRRAIKNKPLMIHLPDYLDRYKRGFIHPSLIFLGENCHWRQIKNITFSFISQVKTIKKFKKIFYNSVMNADDAYLSRELFDFRFANLGRCLCLSPIPGLSTHLHEGVMTPLVNWQQIYHNYLIEADSSNL